MKKRTSLTALLVVVLFLATGCGQKGPLYLPEPPATNDAPEAPEQPQPE